MRSDDCHFVLKLAENDEEIVAAQRLRYRVFVDELKAAGTTVDHTKMREVDAFDAIYDHLLLIDNRIDAASLDHVVGVYRLLRDDVAMANNGFYSAGEYELAPLLKTNRKLLELGRSCVDRAYRGGTAMFRLWSGLADYVLQHDIEVMFGVASYHGTDPSMIAHSLSLLHQNHLAPRDTRVRVRPEHYNRLDIIEPSKIDRKVAVAQTPALIKAYLRLGGFVGDGAFIDYDFNTVDICLMMDTEMMSQRHRQFYSREQGGKS